MRLIRQVRGTIDRHKLLRTGDTVVLGVSGGPDSLCMLHVLRQLADEYGVALHVAHLNHGIRGHEADADARFVAELCRSWELPCTIDRADVPALARDWGRAIEEAARQARYGFLALVARAVGGKSVAVAHNADDQVETVLMHFLRGSGLAGLRGMVPLVWMDELRVQDAEQGPRSEPRARIRLLRPLLEVSRGDIEAYCKAHDLSPRFDRSNLDQTYFRNRLRHQLIPLLETYNPNVRGVVRRMAKVVAADYDLLHRLMAVGWSKVVREEEGRVAILDLATFRAMPLSLQRSVLRECIHRLRFSLRNINWVHIDDALQVIQTGAVGAKATLPQGLVLTLGYKEAVLASKDYEPPREDWPRIQGPVPLSIDGGVYISEGHWTVRTRTIEREALDGIWETNRDPYFAYLDATRVSAPLVLRPRRPGDWFVPLGLNRRQKVSEFMINRKIPRRERANVPLLVCGGDIVWVVGWRLDDRYAVTPETKAVLTVWFSRV